ncbi:hypothetical protein EVAR_86991_1 [Eumeta japonica]|uniref:Uncharacterized protein n=1 Tax=Eumeta variegata TaxID=151549 RepID=A0A4C1W5W9_EUMVA|nr:hypothetical protein EVAR_86991_1 [Eumeta japonica]
MERCELIAHSTSGGAPAVPRFQVWRGEKCPRGNCCLVEAFGPFIALSSSLCTLPVPAQRYRLVDEHQTQPKWMRKQHNNDIYGGTHSTLRSQTKLRGLIANEIVNLNRPECSLPKRLPPSRRDYRTNTAEVVLATPARVLDALSAHTQIDRKHFMASGSEHRKSPYRYRSASKL